MKRSKKLLVTLLALSLTASVLGGCGGSGVNGGNGSQAAIPAQQETEAASTVMNVDGTREIVMTIDSDIGDISYCGYHGLHLRCVRQL